MKKSRHELILVFERFKGFPINRIFDKLPEGFCSKRVLYYYKDKYNKLDRKCRELTKGW